MKELIEKWLKGNPEFTANLKEGATDDLVSAIEGKGTYVIRMGELVNNRNNIAADVGDVIKQHARPFMKSLGSGRYVGRFADRRSKDERRAQAKELRLLYNNWIEAKGYTFIHDEPRRVFLDLVAENYSFESDGNGSFVLAPLFNGVPTVRYTPDQLFTRLGRYIDPEKTEMNQLRIAAKIHDEALKLTQLTPEEVKKPGTHASEYFTKIKERLEKEHYGQHTGKRLPNVSMDVLIDDVRKETAHKLGLPIEPAMWQISEKIQIEGLSQNIIEEADRQAISPFEKFMRERPPVFYQEIYETHGGLPYEYNKSGAKVVPDRTQEHASHFEQLVKEQQEEDAKGGYAGATPDHRTELEKVFAPDFKG